MTTPRKPEPRVAWLDLLWRVAVPVAFAAGAAVISIEIRMGRMDSDISHLKEEVVRLPPAWLRDQVAEVRASLVEIDKRLRVVELQTK